MGIVPSLAAGARSRRRRSVAALRAALIVLLVVPAVPVGAEFAPGVDGLRDDVVQGVPFPTDIDVNAVGDMVIASKSGGLSFRPAGATTFTEVLNLAGAICADGERGLLGAVLDPDFATNRYVYLYYTARLSAGCPTGPEPAMAEARTPSAKKRALARCERIEKPNRRANCRTRTNRSFRPTAPPPPGSSPPPAASPTPPPAATGAQPVNRVARFQMGENGQIPPGTRLILIDNIPSPGSNHNGGDLDFGDDGFLYVSAGDGGVDPSSAQDPSKLLGKILRVSSTGQASPDNPFYAGGVPCAPRGRAPAGARCQEIFALGLRNPFRFAFDPNAAGTRFSINDVGAGTTEEIDEGTRGANYGWPSCEGSTVTGPSFQPCTLSGA